METVLSYNHFSLPQKMKRFRKYLAFIFYAFIVYIYIGCEKGRDE